jgi:hypothetical protein
MKGKPSASRWALLALILWAMGVTPADSADWRPGNWLISWDNTVTYGISVRTTDRDLAIIGEANDGSAYSVNGDDGNLNYDTRIFSNQLQLTSELEFRRNNFGLFFRGWGFYDYENEKNDRARTPLSDPALERVGSRFELRDAYAWYEFRIGKQPAQIRAGRQVVNWGESTFIQGGLNVLNPVDVTALRSPGAELRNALLPVGMVWGSFSMSTNTTLEAFYEYEWEEIVIDPPGSYFSTNDFAGDGGEYVFLLFGTAPDIPEPPFQDPLDPTRPVLGVPRAQDVRADDTGQYGAVLRWLVPKLGGTEFGFYYANYHSRLPTINGRTGTLAGLMAFGALFNPNPGQGGAVDIIGATILSGGDVQTGVGAASPLVPDGAALAIAGTTSQVLLATGDAGTAAAAGGQVARIFTQDAYTQTARYFIAYPEDIKLYGISYNSQIGTTGIALQGELSYRQDAPLQIDDVELLFAALQPINPALSIGPGSSQVTTFLGDNYSTLFETPIQGYILEDTSQFQTTLTKIWPQVLGADQVLFLFEGAVTHIPDMPETDELRLEVAGTYTSGNPWHQDPSNAPLAAHPDKAAEEPKRFADPTSWGYRLVTRFQYNNAIGAVTVSPRLAWGHDVEGNSPGPGGNFIEGRKAYTLGLNFDFQNTWSADISYTDFFGASRYNLINDRDFVAMNFKYSF